MKEKNYSKKTSLIVIAILIVFTTACFLIVVNIQKSIIPDTKPQIEPDSVLFEKHAGENVIGAEIEALCKTTINYNLDNTDKTVRIGFSDKQKDNTKFSEIDPADIINDKGEYGEKYNTIGSTKSYNVKCYYDDNENVKSIIIVENGTKEN